MTRLIDADALTDELIKGIEADKDKSIQTSFVKSVCMIICKAIDAQPTIDAEPVRHGKWAVTHIYIKCSECGESFPLIPQNYCPNCGARMDGDRDEPAKRL